MGRDRPILDQGRLAVSDGHIIAWDVSGAADGAWAVALHGGPGASHDYLEPLVDKHGLDEVLDHWTSSEEAKSCKPHTEIYHYSLKKAGLEIHEALFVGDSLHHDVAGASAVGMRSARIKEEGIRTPLTSGLEVTAEPDFEISALTELINIVDGLNG